MQQNEINTQLSISAIIKKLLNKESTFNGLTRVEKSIVLKYIQKCKLEKKVFESKGYDLLSASFFVYEYVLSDCLPKRFTIKKLNFDRFDDFIKYVNYEIYDDACFYGYKFSDDIIRKYDIDKTKINNDSFIYYTINDHTFEKLKKEVAINIFEKEKNIEKTDKFFKKIDSIDSYEILLKKYKYFNSKFDFKYSKAIFLSLILEKLSVNVENYILKMFCEYGRDCGIEFADLLYYYGGKIVDYVINNYEGLYSLSTKKKRIKEMKKDYELFSDNKTILQKKGGFDKYLYLYYVDYRYYNDDYFFMSHRKYFLGFDSFINDLDGDICFCDLSRAPIEIEVLKKYKYNEKTKFPGSKDYQKYLISKTYDNGYFLVTQKWIDYDEKVIAEHSEAFNFFFDFIHYLVGDISNSNLIICEGVQNIKDLENLKYDGLMVRSDVAKHLGLKLNEIDVFKYSTQSFFESKDNELITTESFSLSHEKDEDYSNQVAYISDIHLPHRYNVSECETYEDIEFVNNEIAGIIADYNCKIKLIGGDIAGNFDVYTSFLNVLSKKKSKSFSSEDKLFFVLGNHELWPFSGMKLDNIICEYNSLFAHYKDMYLVQNNLFYFDDGIKEITTQELVDSSIEELRNRVRSAFLIIFGGIGFAGNNEMFNANNGIYKNTINRNEEIYQSDLFKNLYEKVVKAMFDKNVIIVTHMPITDWIENPVFNRGFVYVNGHSHKNYYYDDGIKRIYSDNQIGYTQKSFNMKSLSINMGYDWFSNYKDGIYEIERNDYINFYRGIKEGVTFNRKYAKLYMIKHNDVYMFLIKSLKGNLQILNGGSIRSANGHDLNYFYDYMVMYSQSLKMFLSEYDEFQKSVSKDILSIGGNGKIHGSIVDIDFFNHLYLNPLDLSITPYCAFSMVEKYVYENLPSLLKKECPNLYLNFEKINENVDLKKLIVFNSNSTISDKTIYVESTEMYRVSRILKGLQFTTKYNIVRLWNDSFVGNPSKEKGKLIASNIIASN
jgi:hypothetical protein